VTLSLAGHLHHHTLPVALVEVAVGGVGEAGGPAFLRSELVAFARALLRGGHAFPVAFHVRFLEFSNAFIPALPGTQLGAFS
jgi:hypothetical protein